MKKLLITSLFGLVLGGLLLTIPKVDAVNFATVFHPITGHRKVVEVGNPLAFNGGYILETKTVNFETVGDINVPCSDPECADPSFGFSVVTRYRTTLSSSMTSSQTTVPVASIATFDGHTLTMSDLGGKLYLTIEPGSSREEIVKCTAISSSQWASCTRGLAFYGTTETSVSANQKAHNAGSIVVMSNVHYVYEQFPDKDAEETIGGVKTFSNLPLWGLDAIGVLPTSSAQLATKRYVDGVGAGGFTSSNIGDGKTLRANGTSPETIDIATSTSARLESFIIDSYGKFSINTTTNEKIDKFWKDKHNATTTVPNLTTTGIFIVNNSSSTIASNLNIAGNSTTTGNVIIGTTSFGTPTNTLSVIGNSYLQGNATTTKTIDVKTLCFDGDGCVSSLVPNQATTTNASCGGSTGATCTVSVDCSGDRFVLSGGYVGSDVNIYVTENYPVDNNTWRVTTKAAGAIGTYSLTVYAMCY